MGYLASKGMACCIHDHLGHGESVATSQDLGYFAAEWAGDCWWRHRRFLPNGSPAGSVGQPSLLSDGTQHGFLCGKTGHRTATGRTDRRHLLRHLRRPPGSSPGTQADRSGDAPQRPSLPLPALEQLIFGGYNQHFGTQYTGKEWLSRNLAVGRVHAQDPLCNFCFTTSAFSDLLRLNVECNTPGWFAAIDSHLPILLIAGTQDPVGQYGKGVAQVARRLRGAGSEDVTLRLYPGARHELLNELNREEVYGTFCDGSLRTLPAITAPASKRFRKSAKKSLAKP